MKPTKALALIDKSNKITPEFIIGRKHVKEYILKKGERFIEVVVVPKEVWGKKNK